MEDFPANGRAPTLDECLREVERAELVIAIVAHRYGWVPDDSGHPDAKSITWLECEHAWNITRREVLAFIVDPNANWPPDQYEGYRLNVERKKPGILQEVERNEANLARFKAQLGKYFRKQFSDVPSLREAVTQSLAEWLNRNPQVQVLPAPGDPDTYLQAIFAETSQIRPMKLKSKRADPYVFDIDEIYIPLTTLAALDEKPAARKTRRKAQPVEHLLQRRTVRK